MNKPNSTSVRSLSVVLVAVCFSVAGGLALRLGAADAPGTTPVKPSLRRCVAVTSQRLNTQVIRVYRVFEDGTVEAADDGAGSQGDWVKVGK